MQQLELKLCGTSMDLWHAAASAEAGGGHRRAGMGHSRALTGLAVLDRLDQLDKEMEGVTRVANKAKVCFCHAGPTLHCGV